MPSTQTTSDETQDLRRCVRDLVALSTLPAVWENADPLGIGRGLAEVLLRMLAADFLYVRLDGRDGGPRLEAMRTRQRAETEARAHEVGKSLEPWLRFEDAHAQATIPNPVGDGMVRLAVFPIGHGLDHGLLAAGCGRGNFPSDTERLLLGVAVNQAAGLLQRKEAEERLRRSEQELADFFENAAVGLHWVGPDGILLRVNQAELDLLGYSREEYLGRHIAEFHADRDVIEDILRRLAAGETLRDYEARMRCRDGSFKHVLINSNVLWEGGRFIHTRCFTRDITDRRLAEESLRKQTEWLRVTLASIGDAVITTDTAGRITSLNPVAESLTGWPQEEANGRPLGTVFRIVNEQSRQGVENPATRALREGQVVGLANHTALIARDGTERAIDDSAAPIKDEQGNLIGVVLIFRDVSEKRRADRALAESEARKAAVLQTALDCIITCDEQGVVLEFNPAAQRTFGYEPAEAIGRDMADLIIPPSLRERHRSGMAHYLATGEEKLLNRHIEMTARRADGTEFPAELAITRIPAPGPPQFTAYLRDITERKSLERRRSARLAVTQVMAQVPTLADAAPRILQAVCEGLGWDMGAFWTVDRQANVLRCQELWHTPSVRAEAFKECCRQRTFDPGIGLPGRVWSSGRPAWIPDAAKDTNFPRAPIAVEEGLHGAFAAPVQSGQELLGVIEFFSREIREPDPDLLEMMATIGGQIGQFIDRKQTDEALRRLAAIVESSDDAIISKNLDGIIVSWNKGAERLYGYTAEEIVGKPLGILVPPDHPDELPAIMQRLRGGEHIEHFETVRVRKDGSRVDVALTISPVKDSQGKIIGASKIARDITKQKHAQQTTRFLADASATLAELTDHESTLQRVASLAVPQFADWCAVDMQEADGSVRRLAVTHTDTAKVQLAHEIFRRYPPQPTDAHGVMAVLRTGEPEWSAAIPDSLLVESAQDEEHLRISRDLGLKSYICVPLRSRTKTLGVLTFVTAESGRVYDADDVRAAQDLASRAVIAIENANLLATLKETDAVRTSSWRCWRTNCATPWPPSATPCKSSVPRGLPYRSCSGPGT
jgi:PAS domain S-box-containing protein